MTTAPPSAARRRFGGFEVILILLCLLGALWPGDTQFVNDDQTLIHLAFNANNAGELARVGLEGTRGVNYGPLPIWIYQLLLLTSHDLRVVVVLRAVAMRAAIAGALVWLGRALKLNRWFIPLVLLSPYVWIYSRELWDNTFCLPLSLLALAAYIHVLERPTAARVAMTLACLAALLLTHLMTLALVIPLGLHMLVYARRALWRHRIVAMAVLVIAVLMPLPYWRFLVGAIFHGGNHQWSGGLQGWWFPLLGGRLLSAFKLTYFFGNEWNNQPGIRILFTLQVLTMLSYALFWLGMARAIVRVVRRDFPSPCTQGEGRSEGSSANQIFPGESRKNPHPNPLPGYMERGSLANHAAVLCLGVIVAQTVLHGLWRLYGHPHYYNGVWAIDVLLSWRGADLLARHKLGRIILYIYGAALIATLSWVVLRVHHTAGTRLPTDDPALPSRSAPYGPTLATQMAIARTINQFAPDSPVLTTAWFFKQFPEGVQVLRMLQPAAPDATPGFLLPRKNLLIRYRSDDPADAHVEVVEQPAGK